MSEVKKIKIIHVLGDSNTLVSGDVFRKLSHFYSLELQKEYFGNLEKIKSDGKVHVLLFDNIQPESIKYSDIEPIIKHNNRLYFILASKDVTEKNLVNCYSKHIDYVINMNFGNNYVFTYLKNILRRRSSKYFLDEIYVSYKNIKIDYLMREVYVNAKVVDTTNKEFKIIAELVNNQEKFTPKKTLFQKVWKYEEDNTRILDQYIVSIRKKLGPKLDIVYDKKNGYKIF